MGVSSQGEVRLKAPPELRVVLVGFMGAGKTTVGRILAARLQCPFSDLDDEIVAAAGRPIADIFQQSGEAEFRRLESDALRRVLDAHERGPLVLAVGGGAFPRPENAARLRAGGLASVFLDAPVEELRRRCAPQAGQRPLFADQNQFRQLYEARRSAYMTADLRLDTSGKNPEQLAAEVVTRLGVPG